MGNSAGWRARDVLIGFWCLFLVIVAGLAIFPGLPAAVSWARNASSDLASWVQAIGSIGAILSGFAVSRMQSNQQHGQQVRLAQENQRQGLFLRYLFFANRLELIAGFADHIRSKQYDGNERFIYERHSIDGFLEMLGRQRDAEIPDVASSNLLHDASMFLVGMRSMLAEIEAGTPIYGAESLKRMASAAHPRLSAGVEWLRLRAHAVGTAEEWRQYQADSESAVRHLLASWTKMHSDQPATVTPAAAAAASPPRAA